MSVWNDEKFAELSALYVSRMNELDEEDRPKHSGEIVKEIAEANGFSANGFRMKLTSAGLYIKKGAPESTKAEGKSTGGARTSKATAHAELVAAFSDGGVNSDELDMAIVEKLTGKAALHLAELVRKITK